MNAGESEGTLTCFSALLCLKDLPSGVQMGRQELEEDCLVAAAVSSEVRVKILGAWIVWHVANRRRCVVLQERGHSAKELEERLQALFPDLRVLVWAGSKAPPWPGPLEYDVVICSFRRFMNRFSRRTRCGFHAIAALDLDSVWLSRDSYLAEALVTRWRQAKHRIRLLGITKGPAKNLAEWLEASYFEVEPPKHLKDTYLPLLDLDSLEDLGPRVSGSKAVALTISDDREELRTQLRRTGVNLPVYTYGQKLEENSWDIAVVEEWRLNAERLKTAASTLKKGGELIILYRVDGEHERFFLAKARRLVRNTLNIDSLQDVPMDWEMLLLHLFRHTLSLRQGLKLCHTSFAAQAGEKQPPSLEEVERLFQQLQEEGLVQRHSTPKSRYSGTARCTEAGDALTKSIFTATARRSAIANNYPKQRSSRPRWEWVLQAAADLVRDEDLEIAFAKLLEMIPGEGGSSEVPDWFYLGLFAIASIDLEVARFIEEHAHRIYPESFTALRPNLYPEAGQRQSFVVALQKVLNHIYDVLVLSENRAGQRKLAPEVSFHYAKVATSLDLALIMVYKIFCDYLGSEQLTPTQVKTVKELGVKAWEQLRTIRSATALTRLLEGPHRPQLVRVFQPMGGEPILAPRYRRTCSECAFFSPDSLLCAVWFHVAAVKESLVEERRAGRRQTSPNLHCCNHFISKARHKISHAQLKVLSSSSPEQGGFEKMQCVRRGCTGLLDGPPRVWKIARCNRCGTIYRKTTQGRTHSQVGFLDLLQERVRGITGTLSRDLRAPVSAQSREKVALFLTSGAAVVTVTSNRLVVEYRGGGLLEEYSLEEVGYLSLSAGQLDRESRRILTERGVRVVFRRNQSPKEPKPRVAKDLKLLTEKEKVVLFRRHCVANYLGLLHATVSLAKHLKPSSVSRLLSLQLDRIYVFSHKTSSTFRQEQSLLRTCEAQMAGVFHKAHRDILAPSGATHSGIGRARGRWVSYRGDRRGLSRGWTPFDAALNLASRILRSRLRRINARLGLGWNAPPLFLHTPHHEPGLGAHLDLEEPLRLALTLRVFHAFHSNRFAFEDFRRLLTPLQIPYFVSTRSISQKVYRLIDSLLGQPVRYHGEIQVWEAAHRNHVNHLLEVLKVKTYDRYEPLILIPPNKEQAWKVNSPLHIFAENLPIFGEPLREVIQELLTQTSA